MSCGCRPVAEVQAEYRSEVTSRFSEHIENDVVVVVVVFTLKTVLTSIQYPSLSYSSRQRKELPWSQTNPKKVQKNTVKIKKDPEKVQHLREKYDTGF